MELMLMTTWAGIWLLDGTLADWLQLVHMLDEIFEGIGVALNNQKKVGSKVQ